jgi:hypothetical protein
MLKISEISRNHVLVILAKKQSDTRMKSGRIAPISSDHPDDSMKDGNTAAYWDRNTALHRMNNINEYSINMQKRKHPPFTVSAFFIGFIMF